MMRFAAVLSAAVLLCSVGSVTPAAAQDAAPVTVRDLASPSALLEVAAPVPAVIRVPSDHRPGALLPLYASFAALQLVDFHSTRYALDRGAVEANPVMKGFANSGAGLLPQPCATRAQNKQDRRPSRDKRHGCEAASLRLCY